MDCVTFNEMKVTKQLLQVASARQESNYFSIDQTNEDKPIAAAQTTPHK